ncbi:MAG: hypothetical protein A2270_11000 [Elusimicrobia bacterium RIFOXYA12_FULL_51_18]|nr:MAG: hypothetical protein A2270_11000 [Elusimicrobia bacterium RIFOXYA12_FULL_51_18]OGS32307.1 MAG: hypothetical protein A2218_02840 [Elusimicrobia bacterium RIFOXYA2_FULL_53_38]
MSQKKRFALITGSGRGLGRELAIVFARNGYDIILHGRNKKDLATTKTEIDKEGAVCDLCAADLSTDSGLRKIYRMIRFREIAVFVNNAGAHCPHLGLEEITDGQIDEMITTNLTAPIKLSREIYRQFLKKSAGALININSVCGLEARGLRTIYAASKWGLRGFSESLRLEAAEKGIRIIDVYPTRIRTKPVFREGMSPKAVAQKIFNFFRNTDSSRLMLDERKSAKKQK